jgi:hypothetical protein
MLLDHNHIDRFGVLECEEAKSTRPASSTIAHYGAFDYLAKL